KACSAQSLKHRQWRGPLSCLTLAQVPMSCSPHLRCLKIGLQDSAFMPAMMQTWRQHCCGCFPCQSRTARRSVIVGGTGCLAISTRPLLPNRRCGFMATLLDNSEQGTETDKLTQQKIKAI